MAAMTNCHLELAIAGLVLVSLPGLSRGDGECNPSGAIRSSTTHRCQDCCKAGQSYPTYPCSPPTTGSSTDAVMTLNDFAEGGDPSECDEMYHKNTELVVALSTGWYAGGSRCGKSVRINANGRSVVAKVVDECDAKVVDECDSQRGCDAEHAYQPPCRPNIVDASQAVWDALGITGEDVGEYDITWSDA